MAKQKGTFIVIDGSDGAGKKTQSDILVEKLKSLGHSIAYYDFPQYTETFFGKMVGRYLNGEFGTTKQISPYLISLMYAGDRYEVSEKMRNDLSAGKIIVSNRYVQSNMAFSGALFPDEKERQKFLDWLYELEYHVFNIPKPDLVVYLYVPFKIGQILVDQKAKRSYTDAKRDIHESNSEYLLEVEKTYLWLADRYPEWRKIDCAVDDKILPIEEISEKVFEIVKKELI
ncbi:MAG: dTMP kinase [Patescibacteria group bacterium]|jgi:dTMP kinase